MPERENKITGYPRPSEFMRARRPYLYSDSVEIEEIRLSEAVFENHLNSLTSRSQEADFERFCRRLAEKEICPNLIPQTGPVGGGDSKVDSETYPVSEEIALTWYEGVDISASHERWAFAFSAKEKWEPKAKSDVEKAVSTNRGYKRVYFITSRFVRDKDRGRVQDELRQKCGVEVYILDRTWIVRCVFEHDRIALACEKLRIVGYDAMSRKVKGPRDVQRELDLKELESHISDPQMYAGLKYQLAEDCLEAALIARGLELPRVEVDGRFERARRVAEHAKPRQQLLRIVYAQAWTAFWWYEDFRLFNSLYDEVEALSTGSIQATDMELLSNLWRLLPVAAAHGDLDKKELKVAQRTRCLASELDRLARDSDRPNTALHARSLRVLMNLRTSHGRGESPDPHLKELGKLLSEADDLPEFPVDPLLRIVSELGSIFVESRAYEDLFEIAMQVRAKRRSEGDTGEAMLQRGLQFLDAGKKYEAIKMFGRAEQVLAKEEYCRTWVKALLGCGLAYAHAGLLWAARANIIIAANQAVSWFMKYGELSSLAYHAMRNLVWMELRLGRIPCVLTWLELADAFARNLRIDKANEAYFAEERQIQDAVLGMLFLRTDFHELKWLDFLPPILDEMGLNWSWMALLYALGYEDYMRSEGAIPPWEESGAVRDLFGKLLEQPAAGDIPERSQTMGTSMLIFQSVVLGCTISISCPNEHCSIFFAETILAALESLLATFVGPELMVFRPELEINLTASDLLVGIPQWEVLDEASVKRIIVRYPAKMTVGSIDEQSAFQKWLFQFILHTTFQFAIPRDPKELAERMARDELCIGRATILAGYFTAMQNILGTQPKIRLSDWSACASEERFPLQRELPWNQAGANQTEVHTPAESPKPARGRMPQEMPGLDKIGHRDMRVLSLIDVPLWDEAEWSATIYVTYPGVIPMIALGFRNKDSAKKIFEGWRAQIGIKDREERLRVVVITGINKEHPYSYRISISSNLSAICESSATRFNIVSRNNRMDPPDGENLNRFLGEYKKTGRYVILPVRFSVEEGIEQPMWQYGIEKKELLVRPAWQIDENDQDLIALSAEDDPIIPDGVDDVPVLRAMARVRK